MQSDRQKILDAINKSLSKRSVQDVTFAEASVAPPLYAFVVNFPSLVFVLSGHYEIEYSCKHETVKQKLKAGQVLYARSNCWYLPAFKHRSQVITVLFGKKQTGFSLVKTDPQSDGPPQFEATKFHTMMPLSNLSRDLIQVCEQAAQPYHDIAIASHLTQALLISSLELLSEAPLPTISKSQQLYEGVCTYVQENFHQAINRDSVAMMFDVTPNHLSRVFQTIGMMRFWDYVTLVRIDRAKLMLKQYDTPIKQIAKRCGFMESSYFCRIFRKRTKLSPTEYRLKYRQE